MREVAEVKEILRAVSSPRVPGNRESEAVNRSLIRWQSKPDACHDKNGVLTGFAFTLADLSAADIAEEALHAIEQLELPRLAEQRRIADLERDLATERAFAKRLLAELRQ